MVQRFPIPDLGQAFYTTAKIEGQAPSVKSQIGGHSILEMVSQKKDGIRLSFTQSNDFCSIMNIE